MLADEDHFMPRTISVPADTGTKIKKGKTKKKGVCVWGGASRTHTHTKTFRSLNWCPVEHNKGALRGFLSINLISSTNHPAAARLVGGGA